MNRTDTALKNIFRYRLWERLVQSIERGISASKAVHLDLKSNVYDIATEDQIIDRYARKILVEPPAQRSVQYDGIHDDVPEPFLGHIEDLQTDAKYCREFSDARVVGPEGYIIVEDTVTIPSVLGWNEKDELYRRKVAAKYGFKDRFFDRSRDRDTVGTCFVFNLLFRSDNFGIWFYDQLPKLYWYEKYVERTDEDPLLVFPELSQFQKESLEYMGYGETEYRELSDEILDVEKLVVPPQMDLGPKGPCRTSTNSINWVRENLLSAVDGCEHPGRIYISRNDADWRYVVNEEQVMDALSEYGFEKFILSELDLDEQMNLFAGADVVVGPHGAGNAHMIHSEDCAWVEIFPGERGAKPFYFVLANYLGHDYDYLVCEPGEVHNPHISPPRHRDITVEIDELERMVTQFVTPISTQG